MNVIVYVCNVYVALYLHSLSPRNISVLGSLDSSFLNDLEQACFCGSPSYQVSHLKMIHRTWWRHQMETFAALLALCAGNSPVTGEFPAQRPVTRSFDVFFNLRLNKRLSKQSWGWWFETPSRSLWRHRNEIVIWLRCLAWLIASCMVIHFPRI